MNKQPKTIKADGGLPVSSSDLLGVPKSPHRCPVCFGKGKVPAGFYDEYDGYTTAVKQPETCRGCGGTGVIVC
jgi:DnaJ-class molecular chaperone